MADGRFAPSPTGPLHLGSLRTALLAWLFARSSGGRFLVRVEDLDLAAARPEIERAQLADLTALGLVWDGPVERQSDRRERYDAVIGRLVSGGHTYECFCTRREIAEAAAAPHGEGGSRGKGSSGDGSGGDGSSGDGSIGTGAYPGTCRRLDEAERERRRSAGRPPALRLDAAAITGGAPVVAHDRLLGDQARVVDDFVVRRNDGVPAYNLAVVVDDAAQGVDEVVRGDDLWPTTPRQVLLARVLGLPPVTYAHVPLVLGADGQRLAKRHGSVTLADLTSSSATEAEGYGARTPAEVCGLLAASLGLAPDGVPAGWEVAPAALLDRFDPAALPREPWVVDDLTPPSRTVG